MKILIRGAGLAGLTAARALAVFSRSALDVTVREVRRDRMLPCDVGVGLWPAAQRALDRLGSPGRRLRGSGFTVPPAAYRSRDGAWLSQSTGRRVRVRTICENQLRSFLYEEDVKVGECFGNASETGPFCWSDRGVTFVHGDVCESGFDDVSFENVDYDLVIDATGSSGVLAHVSPLRNDNVSLGVSGIVTRSDTRSRGSGSLHMDMADLFQGLPARPFETLVEPCVRIAVVPLSSDGEQFFWFVSGMERVLSSHDLPESSPLSAWLDACAHTIDGSTHVPMSVIVAKSSSMTIRRVYEGSNTTYRSHEKNVVRIGDAANHLPNNLAQGASVAIEDGHAIGSIVALAASVHAAEEDGEKDMAETVAACINEFTRLREPRVRDCRVVSKFTQYISALPALAGCMRFVPAPINSRVFDAFLDASLGGGGSDPDSVLGPLALVAPVRGSTKF